MLDKKRTDSIRKERIRRIKGLQRKYLGTPRALASITQLPFALITSAQPKKIKNAYKWKILRSRKQPSLEILDFLSHVFQGSACIWAKPELLTTASARQEAKLQQDLGR
ncbi:hypothetical protein AKJ39_03215 [candidate division MSBL1 archaeon SCGC-AAA259J03]|uniref:Uncharacterized protein n=1 Tax=candidate division MSBL1 archaeon SCGC-AAA259J03 TaxID=1698269 RepID=A0A656YWE5_9EURY|nr:hypothetical protein AKJ39_03215 [candidate division MSBL1 archaeon SCGC-AAA259J03]